jgi:hypothetical protein
MTVYFQFKNGGHVTVNHSTWDECMADAERRAQFANTFIKGWEIIEDNK